MNQTQRENDRKKIRMAVKNLCTHLFVSIACIVLVFQVIYGVALIHGEDMKPSLLHGDLVLFQRMKSAYISGDVVIYEANGKEYAGRIAAVGGDIISFNEEGDLLVNGSLRYEPEIKEKTFPRESTEYPCELKEDEYYILADKRTAGIDSRTLGSQTKKQIKGKVIAIFRIFSI